MVKYQLRQSVLHWEPAPGSRIDLSAQNRRSMMQETTTEDRRRELKRLQDQITSHPERDWTQQRQRIAVLAAQLAAIGKG